jgi:glycine/D-amino acid oxidase-like deaminating enzyme
MVSELRREAEAAKRLGIDARFVKGSRITELPFSVQAAVRFAEQLQFHPLEFLAPLVRQLEVYENTKAIKVREHQVFTNHGVITAQNIIFATHYPFVNVPGFYFLRQHQERSYVLGLCRVQNRKDASKEKRGAENLSKSCGEDVLTGMYYSVDTDGLSLRPYENMVLLGGGSHRTGKGVDAYDCKCLSHERGGYGDKSLSCGRGHVQHEEKCKNHGKGYAYLREKAKIYYPDMEECAAWAAQDCMPHDDVPFIGKYSLFRPYWYVATGFHKWGMTTSMIAAMEISHQIVEGERLYGRTFIPQRLFLQAGIKNLLVDIWESIRGLWKGLWAEKERKCPHMGCELEWNEEEQSWDCPCHGSRFDKEGKILDNPAQINCEKTCL